MNPWDVEPPKGFKSWREFSLAGNVVDTNYLLTEAYNRIAALEAELTERTRERDEARRAMVTLDEWTDALSDALAATGARGSIVGLPSRDRLDFAIKQVALARAAQGEQP